MRTIRLLVSMALAGAPAAAMAQYERIANPPDPAAQLAEMIGIYDSICLRAFPDDAAVDRAMAAMHADVLGPAEIRRNLHNDPGRGWTFVGRTGRFLLTIENPPYHACGLRAMTVAGFPDMGPYQLLAERFESGGHFTPIEAVSQTVGELHVNGGGERREVGGGSESLLVVLTTADQKLQSQGQVSTEVRFVHQLYHP